MSNTSFNFLSDSYLLKDNKDVFIKKSLLEIEQELDNYRKFLNDSQEALDKECIKDNEDSVAISDFRSLQKPPTIEEITRKSLFLNRFVIDDPLQPMSFKNFEITNIDRQARGFKPITETEAKLVLWEKIQYMKSLLPGVKSSVGYIKFYPLSQKPTSEFLHLINIPDLSFPNEHPEIFDWFQKKIIIKTINDNKQLIDLIEPCKQLGISFENDNDFPLFMPAFMYKTPIAANRFSYENVIPSIEIYKQWKEQEIIASIRDRFVELIRTNDFRIKFGAILSTESAFENDFLNSAITPPVLTTDAKVLKIITKMNIPSLSLISFERVMEVRQFFDEAFEGFRKQLKEDILYLQQTSDQKQIESFSKELEVKYESMIKEVENKLKFKFNFSDIDFVPTGLDIVTLLTTTEHNPMMLTGANILYKIYDGLVKQRNKAKHNECYFLYKLK